MASQIATSCHTILHELLLSWFVLHRHIYTGPVISFKLRYIAGFGLEKPTIYRNLYENKIPGVVMCRNQCVVENGFSVILRSRHVRQKKKILFTNNVVIPSYRGHFSNVSTPH